MPDILLLVYRVVQGFFAGVGIAATIIWFVYRKCTKNCKFCNYRKPKSKLNEKGVCPTCEKNIKLVDEVKSLNTQLSCYSNIVDQMVEKERDRQRKEDLEKDYLAEEGIREEDLSDIMAELRGM